MHGCPRATAPPSRWRCLVCLTASGIFSAREIAAEMGLADQYAGPPPAARCSLCSWWPRCRVWWCRCGAAELRGCSHCVPYTVTFLHCQQTYGLRHTAAQSPDPTTGSTPHPPAAGVRQPVRRLTTGSRPSSAAHAANTGRYSTGDSISPRRHADPWPSASRCRARDNA